MAKVTIKDIAREAGVSVGTVSKVLNGRSDIKEKNLLRIQEVIKNTNYAVNRSARSLARLPIKVGIILPNTGAYPYFAQIRRGIEAQHMEYADSKFSLSFFEYDSFEAEADIVNYIDQLVEDQVDGIILAPAFRSGYAVHLDILKNRNLPLVFLSSEIKNVSRLASVRIDAEQSGELAADLASLSMHKNEKIAVLLGNKDTLEHQEKAESFLKRAQQINLDVCGVYETQEDLKLAYILTKKLLETTPALGMIYVATGRSMTVCEAIRDCKMESTVKVLVTDNLFEGLETYIESGMIIGAIDQHAKQQGRIALKTLYEYLTEKKLKNSGITRIHPTLMLRAEIEKAIVSRK